MRGRWGLGDVSCVLLAVLLAAFGAYNAYGWGLMLLWALGWWAP